MLHITFCHNVVRVRVVALTEVEGHGGVVVCFAVSDEVDLVLPLLLLQPVFGAAMVTHTAAAQNKDDGPDQPKPYSKRKINTGVLMFTVKLCLINIKQERLYSTISITY